MDIYRDSVVNPSGQPGPKHKQVANEATSTPLRLHDETARFLKKLHKLKSTGNTLADYEELRDEVMRQTERVSTHITILAEVIRIVAIARDWEDEGLKQASSDHKWVEFKAIAKAVEDIEGGGKKRKEPGGGVDRNEKQRQRDFATIAALWSPKLVGHYRWETASHTHMRLLRKCARACPDFAEDFLPSANTVLVARQRASLQNSKVKTIKETRACNTNTRRPSGKPSPASRCSLTFQDLHHVSDLVEKGEVEMYGEQLSRSSVDPIDLDLWVTSEDSEIPIGEDATLCSLRPQHYRQYLLQPDNFGLLQDRKDAEDVTPKKKASVISKKKVSVISKKASSVDKSYWQATKNLSRTGQPSKGTVRSSTRRKALTPDTRAADQDLEADPVIDATASHSHITRQSSISTLTPLTSAESSPETSSAKSLRVLDPFQVHQGALSIEESLHNKHHEEIQLYAAKLQDESDQSDMHSVRAAWLTQATRWASIWTPPECGLGFGFALVEEIADVHYCTSEYFLQAGR
ncbi:hypothetical protein M409DRAFT_30581 [Zasmidium cellare ATCC 36951]|uniref:Uncharacterized protein n=1 Tax=Zasmidium cellare ATCC 36951 TaxID=1080233 RepID=A0A6A6BZD0_ZASCE|nr:uncharacterized protein M409DRAFT_30581 [Zasmidium cellare ATCC 36951]KAF2158952.1 hypothetical protein M409DRAFT_30581 [Zasmidium cellare ATCC 36951]